MRTLYAVIWLDFWGMASLNKETPQDAIDLAQSMNTRANGTIRELRAVELTPEDKLLTLWSPQS